MFKMNPSAKEFVPAHLLKKRQEEAERLGELTDQLDKVNINKNEDFKEASKENCENEKRSKPEDVSKGEEKVEVQENSTTNKPQTQDGDRLDSNDKNSTTSTSNNQQNDHSDRNNAQNNIPTATNNNYNINNNNHYEGEYPDGLQDLIDEEDDRFLLNAGENICEFNGEQFIIPGDDEYVPANRAGYDFGNAEDNEDEDVCNAFEEFLDNLPGQ